MQKTSSVFYWFLQLTYRLRSLFLQMLHAPPLNRLRPAQHKHEIANQQ